jgi:hypothetical protein
MTLVLSAEISNIAAWAERLRTLDTYSASPRRSRVDQRADDIMVRSIRATMFAGSVPPQLIGEAPCPKRYSCLLSKTPSRNTR